MTRGCEPVTERYDRTPQTPYYLSVASRSHKTSLSDRPSEMGTVEEVTGYEEILLQDDNDAYLEIYDDLHNKLNWLTVSKTSPVTRCKGYIMFFW